MNDELLLRIKKLSFFTKCIQLYNSLQDTMVQYGQPIRKGGLWDSTSPADAVPNPDLLSTCCYWSYDCIWQPSTQNWWHFSNVSDGEKIIFSFYWTEAKIYFNFLVSNIFADTMLLVALPASMQSNQVEGNVKTTKSDSHALWLSVQGQLINVYYSLRCGKVQNVFKT